MNINGPWRSTQSAFRSGWRVIAVFVVVMLLLGSIAAVVNPWLEYERAAVSSGDWWRFITAHLAHVDLGHAALNAAGLVVVFEFGRRSIRGGEWILLTLVSLAAVDAGLFWASPQVEWYVGASGVLHGLLAGAGVFLVVRDDWKVGLSLLVVLGAKILWEKSGGTGLISTIGGGFAVVTQAHAYGAVGGFLAAVAEIMLRREKLR